MDIFRDLQHHILELCQMQGTKAALAIGLATLHQAFGTSFLPIHEAIMVLFVTDWILGLTLAMLTRTVSSSASLRGVLKGLVYATVILVSVQIDKAGTIGPWLGTLLLTLIVYTESVSVLEKADTFITMYRLNIPFIRLLINFLKQRTEAAASQLANGGDNDAGM